MNRYSVQLLNLGGIAYRFAQEETIEADTVSEGNGYYIFKTIARKDDQQNTFYKAIAWFPMQYTIIKLLE